VAHGHPRATKDLDVWVMIDPSNADRLLEALAQFGMESLGLEVSDFLEPDVVVQLGYQPVRIDILTSIDGVSFDECWDERMMVDVGGVEAGFISRERLIANKPATGRPQDTLDADELDRAAGEEG
jgi:hypothetical protein